VIGKMKKEEFNKKVDKIYKKAEENSDWKDDAEGFISPCGHCTECCGNSYYEKMNRIGEHYAFAENSCYTLCLQRKEGDFVTTIAYYKNEKWNKGEDIDYEDAFYYLVEAVREMKEFQSKKEEKIKKAIKELNKELD